MYAFVLLHYFLRDMGDRPSLLPSLANPSIAHLESKEVQLGIINVGGLWWWHGVRTILGSKRPWV